MVIESKINVKGYTKFIQSSSYATVWSKTSNCYYALGIARLHVEVVSITIQNSKGSEIFIIKNYKFS